MGALHTYFSLVSDLVTAALTLYHGLHKGTFDQYWSYCWLVLTLLWSLLPRVGSCALTSSHAFFLAGERWG